ncbi:MAG: NAD(+)/NADH kinase [Thermoleophilaceae bacterium]|nr:NAD(+)/NADH kinase [Thermoleophilaceae bacterium]
MNGTRPERIAVMTRHTAGGEIDAALERLREVAKTAGAQIEMPSDEREKHPQFARDAGTCEGDIDLALVLGGDGTILRALRTFAGRQVPVFAVNYGAIGFLSTVERGELEDGLRRAIEGDYEIVSMPALAIETPEGVRTGVNDISVQRGQRARVAELAYSVGEDVLGQVRCDGLVASTPVGSTGYNLANGGPVLAWGVEGFVVSFIAPHTLTARTLVVAPGDVLKIRNASHHDEVDVLTDGRPAMSLGPGQQVGVGFVRDQVRLAQLPGANFYHRLREKFGRLAY